MSELTGVLAVAVNNEAAVFGLDAETQSLLFYALDIVSNYRNWLSSSLDEVTDADKLQIDDLIDNASYQLMNAVLLPYPPILDVPMLGATKISGTTLTWTSVANQIRGGGAEVTPAAQYNWLRFPLFARAGTYTARIRGFGNTNHGITTMQMIGGTLQPTFDWYTAALSVNTLATVTIDVPTDGENYLDFLVASKRAASSGYRFLISEIYLERTGD